MTPLSSSWWRDVWEAVRDFADWRDIGELVALAAMASLFLKWLSSKVR